MASADSTAPRIRIRLCCSQLDKAGRMKTMKRTNLAGERFGRWTVTAFAHATAIGQAYWRCRCTCGTERVVYGGHLKSGKSTTCGCWRQDAKPACHRGHLRAEFGFKRLSTSGWQCRACDRMNARLRTKTDTLSRENLAVALEGLAHGLTINQIRLGYGRMTGAMSNR